MNMCFSVDVIDDGIKDIRQDDGDDDGGDDFLEAGEQINEKCQQKQANRQLGCIRPMFSFHSPPS